MSVLVLSMLTISSSREYSRIPVFSLLCSLFLPFYHFENTFDTQLYKSVGTTNILYYDDVWADGRPVVIPLLSEGDLHTELHPHVVNLLKAPDEEIDPDDGGPVQAVTVRVCQVLSLSLANKPV